jgi:hypothetical protein
MTVFETPEVRSSKVLNAAVRSVDGQLWLANFCLGPADGDFAQEVLASFSTYVQDVLGKYGMSAFQTSKRRAAIHEIGHAIVFKALGEPLHSSRIHCHASAWGGHTDGGDDFSIGVHSSPEECVKLAMTTLAGFAAENLLLPLMAGSSIDEQFMARVYLYFAAKKMSIRYKELRDVFYAELGRLFIASAATLQAASRELEKTRHLRGTKLNFLLASIEPSTTLHLEIVQNARASLFADNQPRD